MKKTSLASGEWVVVCDGRKAIILENAGDAAFVNLRVKEALEHPDLATRDQGVSRPGRTFAPVASRRSAVHQTDWHDEAERMFLRNLAERLTSAVEAGQARVITIAAPPRALGVLREAYSPTLHQAISRELAKDLVKCPTYEIERMLASAET